MNENEMGAGEDQPVKNVGRRRLLQMLTAGGGLAAAGLVPSVWSTPVADILNAAPAAAGVPPSPTPTTSVSPTPSVSVSLTTSPPPPTPSVQPDGVVRATPPFTG
jgi:hypothetical protein